MDKPIVKVKSFSKIYGGVTAVDNISFEVFPGEIFGLLGPNGAGKTSTLECLEGLRKPDKGTMEINRFNPSKNPRKIKNIIGVQLQTSSLPESITVDEAMKLFCAYHDIQPTYDLIERLGLKDKRKNQYHTLSTGQQRRLNLAIAAAHKPRVLILDEPTAGLDVESRTQLHELMEELKEKGTAIIIATHDMAEAEKMADKIAILLKGRIVETGTPQEITLKGNSFTKISIKTVKNILIKNKVTFQSVNQSTIKDDYIVFYSSDIGITVPEIINYINSNGDVIIDLRVERPSLEERFLEITNNGGAV